MPMITLICCGAQEDCACWETPAHLPHCVLVDGARWRCSCEGAFCDVVCDGAFYWPDGSRAENGPMLRNNPNFLCQSSD